MKKVLTTQKNSMAGVREQGRKLEKVAEKWKKKTLDIPPETRRYNATYNGGYGFTETQNWC